MNVFAVLACFYGSVVLTSPSPLVSSPSVALNFAGHKKKSDCIKVNRCKCIMRDGSGVIDLGSLGDSEGFLERLKPIPSSDTVVTEVLVSFNPCIPFSEPEDLAGTECTDVATCLIARTNEDNGYVSRYINYGRHEENRFHYNDSVKTLTVSYLVYAGSEPQTVVHYHCSSNHSISYSQHSLDKEPLQIWVESPCVCPNACTVPDVGPGTIFLIILSLSATAYFILGSCALRPFRSSSGVQIAPENSVWCMLCYKFTERPGQDRRRLQSLRDDTL